MKELHTCLVAKGKLPDDKHRLLGEDCVERRLGNELFCPNTCTSPKSKSYQQNAKQQTAKIEDCKKRIKKFQKKIDETNENAKKWISTSGRPLSGTFGILLQTLQESKEEAEKKLTEAE